MENEKRSKDDNHWLQKVFESTDDYFALQDKLLKAQCSNSLVVLTPEEAGRLVDPRHRQGLKYEVSA